MFVYHLQSIPVRENLHSQRNKPVNRKTFKYTLSKPERSLSMSMYPSLSRRKWLQYTTIALLYLVYPKQVEAFDTTRIDYISPKEAYQRLHQGNSKLVDVRSTEEYTSQHIQGAVSIPLSTTNDFVLSFQKQFPLDTCLVIVCQTGMRSSKAAEQLRQAGYSHVSVIRGGLNEWNRQMLPWTIMIPASS